MSSTATALPVAADDLAVLRRWAQASSIPAALAQRAKLLLLAADGVSNTEVAGRLGVSRPTVIGWRRRYAREGLVGLTDRPRPGRPQTVRRDRRAEILATTLTRPPEHLGITHSPHFMERICRQVRGLIRLARGEQPGALADAATAVELLAELAERGALATNPDWSGQLAIVLQALGRGSELDALATTAAMPTPWLTAATALAAGRDEAAADIYAEIGSLPDEAYARLRAAQQHLAAGRRTEGAAQLRQATAFYRQVRASGYLRQADALIAASA